MSLVGFQMSEISHVQFRTEVTSARVPCGPNCDMTFYLTICVCCNELGVPKQFGRNGMLHNLIGAANNHHILIRLGSAYRRQDSETYARVLHR